MRLPTTQPILTLAEIVLGGNISLFGGYLKPLCRFRPVFADTSAVEITVSGMRESLRKGLRTLGYELHVFLDSIQAGFADLFELHIQTETANFVRQYIKTRRRSRL